jgi:hypothetical protein
VSPVYSVEANLNRYHKQIDKLREQYGTVKDIPKKELDKASEVLRAEQIVCVAERDGLDPAKALRQGFVAQTTIAQMGYKPTVSTAKRGAKALAEFVKKNIGITVDIFDLSEAGDCSEATARLFIRNNRSQFAKMGPGSYQIIDVAAARQEIK